MKKRIEIEEADNGYTVKVWGEEKEEGEEKEYSMYHDAKILVASTVDEVAAILKKHLK